jgi:hypothetical protein
MNLFKKLEAARAQLAILEQQVATDLNKELKALPEQYGFESVSDFIAAVRAASGKRRSRKPGKAAKHHRKRAKITDETRASVKKMVEAEKTGAEIAAKLGISLPSVQNIKKALGLVRKK